LGSSDSGGGHRKKSLPLDMLIQDGLHLIGRRQRPIPHSYPDLRPIPPARTESQSALHDGGAPFCTARKELYHLDSMEASGWLIGGGGASPLSRPRTMSILARVVFGWDDIRAWWLEHSLGGGSLMVEVSRRSRCQPSELSLDSDVKSVLKLRSSSDRGLRSIWVFTRRHRSLDSTVCLIVDDSALMCRALHRDLHS